MLKNLRLTFFSVLAVAIFLSLTQCKTVEDPGTLFLPKGFVSTVYVERIKEKVRHMTVSENGDLYVKLRRQGDQGAIAAIRDTNRDGIKDSLVKFGSYHQPQRGSYSTGIEIYKDYLYFSSELTVYRYKLDPDKLIPTGDLEIIVHDDHSHGSHEHMGKPIAIDDNGYIYVPFGSPNNACQNPKRTPMVPGEDPCPILEDHAGIWRFDAEKIGQTQKDGELYASGLRSIVALDWNSEDKHLYSVVHGRDDLTRLWPNKFNQLESALLPSEEFVKIEKGDHFGWPYCYYDQIQEKKVLAPEYGGDGNIIGRCDQYKDPIIGFPGHWAPNDLVFYKGNHFPERYKNGAFIAFHGSTNRSPYPQSGYFVGFVPFKDGKPSGDYEVFADGFAKVDPIVSVKDAVYRPMSVAFSPDGSMYIGETVTGRIWRVEFEGDREKFGDQELTEMLERKNMSHIRSPDIINDKITLEGSKIGQGVFNQYCMACHQSDGKGDSGRFPSLVDTDWVNGDKQRLINLVINGMNGPIEVNGEPFDGLMPQHSFLSDEDIADVLTYIRTNFGNNSSPVSNDEIAKFRKTNSRLKKN